MQADPPPAYQQTFARVSDTLKQQLGHQLFTVSRILPGVREVERIFTTRPDVYPVHGRKTMDDTPWTAQMARGECFVASHPSAFGAHFGDIDTIVSIGLGAVVNVPVHDGERQMGTLNLLDATGAYAGDLSAACAAAQRLAVKGFREYEEFLQRSRT